MCNIDFASFTENPHTTIEFSSFQNNNERYFDSSSVIFILEKHISAKVFSPLSIRSQQPYSEAESLVAPGKFFKIIDAGEKTAFFFGKHQVYIEVLIHETEPFKPMIASAATLSSTIEFPDHVYDLRTGERINLDVWSSRLGYGSSKCIAWD